MLLYYVTDRRSCPSPVDIRIREALEAGVEMVQIREKDLEARELFELVRAAAVPRRGKLLVNSRADVALAAGADGVHLPSGAPAASRLRSFTPPGFVIGRSCHSVGEVCAAEQGGADFAVFGPVFDTPSKRPFGPPAGLERLREACRSARIPVLALGGVNLENARSCLDHGAAGIAAISLFQSGEAIASVVAKLRAIEAER